MKISQTEYSNNNLHISTFISIAVSSLSTNPEDKEHRQKDEYSIVSLGMRNRLSTQKQNRQDSPNPYSTHQGQGKPERDLPLRIQSDILLEDFHPE
ncbi:hypothetical protein RAS12_22975 [Achromobacter seleniivolatilans]|uniref:Uncharacterized protein n=1 Tax=Achromobacter seleniivolatilans TaxID=3047478 RepID=A0ABY9M0S0_9BURK|nr:hypothetical protein [Achromobacter sp. R39]WMD19457.1 hypothetical protein RAS12_22975 [Achromobacter sp. R39]